jgi:hypothetical protein
MTMKRKEVIKSVKTDEDGVIWIETDGHSNRLLVFYGNALTTIGSWLISKGEPYATYFEMQFDGEEGSDA